MHVQAPKNSSPKKSKSARDSLDEKQVAEFKEAFELFDTDKTGSIDHAELTFACKALGMPMTKQEIDTLMKKVDIDGGGTVSFDEFLDLLAGKAEDKDPNEACKSAFKLFDTDNTGRITLKNLKAFAKNMGTTTGAGPLCDNEPELQQMLDEIDPSGKGVTYEDFKILMGRQGVFDFGK